MVGVGAGWVLFEVDSPRVMPCQLGRMGYLVGRLGSTMVGLAACCGVRSSRAWNRKAGSGRGGGGGQVGACERAPQSIGEEERKGLRGVWGKVFWSGRNAQQKNS